MTSWKVAAVQMDCRLGEKEQNLRDIRARLREAAMHGARLIVFPECVLTGYSFESKDEAGPHAESVPGLVTEVLGADCHSFGVWAVVGMLERGPAGELFNACALIGPQGQAQTYRKIHLPFLGVDRFATPGDRPFAVEDLGGLRIGMNICYDGGFPESGRVLTLLGADLIVLPTNWPTKALRTVRYLVQARALENHVYYLAANRIGEERGFRFLGMSRIVATTGDLLAASEGDGAEILYAEIDPATARDKRVVNIPGKYEINRIADRRPEMYGPLAGQN